MGFSPYYLMYGQISQLPVDLYFSTQKADMNATSSAKFVQQLSQTLKWAYKTTHHVTEKENEGHK